MRSVSVIQIHEWTLPLAVAAAIILGLAGKAYGADNNSEPHLQISSRTFQNGGTLPDRMADTILNSAGVNTCTLDGMVGGNASPQLSWSNAPAGTASFVIVMYDETASFTHWGVYDIPADVHSVPANLAPDSGVGIQIYSDFFTPGYTGPCPPTGVSPTRHRYTVTVYALADKLDVVNLPNFPAVGESIYQALIKAARRGQILQSSNIEGFASTTPKK